MAIPAYEGHAATSASKAKATADADSPLAPADRNNYDPADYTDQPGAGARASGYPRHDGQS